MIGPIIKETLGFGSTKFEVTPKGKKVKRTKTDNKLLASHAVLLALSILGIVLAAYKSGILGIELYIIPLIWLIFNTFYLIAALIFDLRKSRVNKDFVPNQFKKYGIKSYLGILRREK